VSTATEVRVPDIGDFTDVPVIEILVAPGDSVGVDDPLVTLESDKATMEIPAPAAGACCCCSSPMERGRHPQT
jgi:pyruvate dehydrogenase E2 component (dihydrolipoamide acetyltransferase)